MANFTGVLQADAYAGFDRLYGEKIMEAACWAHVWRKFYDIHVSLAPPIALEALERIGRLYKTEEESGFHGSPSRERCFSTSERALSTAMLAPPRSPIDSAHQVAEE